MLRAVACDCRTANDLARMRLARGGKEALELKELLDAAGRERLDRVALRR